jgi:FKBP-type peptidyl-prolyl cis-trans isomerase 2
MKKLKVVALLAILLGLNMVLSGCLEEEKKEKPLQLELIGTSHKIFAGDSTTYVIVVQNNRNENDTITLSITDKPSEWDVTLNQTKINLTKKRSFGIFVVVNASQDASKGDHKVKIQAISDVDDTKTSISIITKVIEEDGTMVRQGDKVGVDYLGYLVEYKVFDTSIEDIARNGAIQKTSDFSARSSYEPLKVYVGPTDPDPSDPYGSVVEGFWEAIVGMRVGQSRTVILPPRKAYGEYTNATLNVTEEVLMLETMSLDDFNENYTEKPIEGLIMKHHFWGWNASIDYVNESEGVVRILNEPYLHRIINAYGWDSEVTYKNQSDNGGEGRILVEHYAEAGMQAVYLNRSAEVIAIEDDQIKLEYNISPHYLGNEILNFDITLVDILD